MTNALPPRPARRIGIFARSRRCLIAVAQSLLLLAIPILLPAAEKAASKPDPILADLKATATAEWKPMLPDTKPKPPALRIVVHLHGPVIDRASCFGEWKLDSMLDDSGKSFRWQCACESTDLNTLGGIDHGDDNAKQGGAEFHFEIPNHPAIRAIRELRGSVALVTGGECRKVIISDAFKHLPKPIKTDDSENLGIQRLAVFRWPKSRWPKDLKIKDSFAIRANLESNAIVDCEILAADGSVIPSKWRRLKSTALGAWTNLLLKVTGFDDSVQDALGEVEHVTVGLNAGTKVPEDAKLRLTIQKDCKIRVPFAVKDIPIPEIDKDIDIPASREEAFVEAVTIGSGDPIFAGLKFQAEAGWEFESGRCSISSEERESMRCCKAYEFVLPDLTLTLQGNPADLTTAYGEVDVVSASDEKGHPLDLFPDTSGLTKTRSFGGGDPTVKFKFAPLQAPHRIRDLRGTLALQTSDQSSVVIITNLLKKTRKAAPIDDPSLKAAGVVVRVTRSQEPVVTFGGIPSKPVQTLDIALEWQRDAVVRCEVLDGGGRPLEDNGSGISLERSRSVTRSLTFKTIPEDAQLRLIVQKNSRKVRVPFEFKDIVVPPIPEEYK